MNKKLHIAVLLATYNGETFIEEQLVSLLNQSYTSFTCYIHDDGSTDKTISICKKYCQEYPNHFVFLEYPGSGGAKENFFSLMNHVEADYYFFCDQDDFWHPNKIENMINKADMFVRSGECVNGLLVFSDLKVTDDKLNVIEESFFRSIKVDINKIDYKNSLIKGFVPGCAMMVDRKLLDKAKNYSNLQNVKMHDWWIVILAYLINSKVIFINEPLVLYRQHTNNTIGVQNQSTIDRIKFNVNRIITGEIRSAKRDNLSTPRLQAMELYNTGYGNTKKRKFLKQFYELNQKNKIYRILFYICNFKHIYRLWWMLLWV